MIDHDSTGALRPVTRSRECPRPRPYGRGFHRLKACATILPNPTVEKCRNSRPRPDGRG
jgi:hypothetical protein